MDVNKLRQVRSFNLERDIVKWLVGIAKENGDPSVSNTANRIFRQVRANYTEFNLLVHNSSNINNTASDKNIQNVTVEQGGTMQISISDKPTDRGKKK